MKVGILGGGKWGQALARLVIAAGNEPFIAYRDVKRPPHLLPSTDDPPQVTAACDLILVATSAGYVRNAVKLAQPGARHRVVVAGRGLEPATSRWLTEVVLEESPTIRVGALAGPAPVDEILNGGLCAGVVASPFEEVRRMTTEALHSNRYRLYDSPDLVGVQLAGAMAPVLATLVGVARGMQGAGVGIHAMVLTRGLQEATRLARAMGADPMTFAGLAGVGDLVAAQALPGHVNFEAGMALTRGDRRQGPGAIAEALVRLAKEHEVELPLTEALCAIYAGTDPLDVVQELMSRPATSEI